MTVVLANTEFLTMADSVTEQALEGLTDHWGRPFDAFGGYVNGIYADFAAIAAAFPNAHLLDFTVFLANVATAGDVEPGDMDPSQGAQWAAERIAAGVWRPVVYGGCSDLKTVVADLAAMGIDHSQVRLMSAHYWPDGNGGYVPHICGPSSCDLIGLDLDATQWAGWGNVPNHGNYDESLLVADFFGAPAPKPSPSIIPEDPMDTIDWADYSWRAMVTPAGHLVCDVQAVPGSGRLTNLDKTDGAPQPSYGCKFKERSFQFQGKTIEQLVLNAVGAYGFLEYTFTRGESQWVAAA